MKSGWMRNSLILCGSIGVMMAIGVIDIAGVLKEYSFVICMALLIALLVVGVCMAVIANVKDAIRPSEVRIAEEQEVEIQRREAIRDEFLPIACGTLAHVAMEKLEANKLRYVRQEGNLEGLVVKKVGDSIVVFMKDDASPYTVSPGVRGWPVIHLSVRPEEEKKEGIELSLGSYENPPRYFSIDQRWESLTCAAEYIEAVDLLQLG